MNKYDSQKIYCGNLMQGEVLLKENIILIYDNKTDTFYSYLDTFNHLLDLNLNNNLTEEETKELEKTIQKYNYPYGQVNSTKKTYIDENTIRIFVPTINNKSTRKK